MLCCRKNCCAAGKKCCAAGMVGWQKVGRGGMAEGWQGQEWPGGRRLCGMTEGWAGAGSVGGEGVSRRDGSRVAWKRDDRVPTIHTPPHKPHIKYCPYPCSPSLTCLNYYSFHNQTRKFSETIEGKNHHISRFLTRNCTAPSDDRPLTKLIQNTKTRNSARPSKLQQTGGSQLPH